MTGITDIVFVDTLDFAQRFLMTDGAFYRDVTLEISEWSVADQTFMSHGTPRKNG